MEREFHVTIMIVSTHFLLRYLPSLPFLCLYDEFAYLASEPLRLTQFAVADLNCQFSDPSALHLFSISSLSC